MPSAFYRPRWRVAWRFPDREPETTMPLSEEAARTHYGHLRDSGRTWWVELQELRDGVWTVVEWAGVKLVEPWGQPGGCNETDHRIDRRDDRD